MSFLLPLIHRHQENIANRRKFRSNADVSSRSKEFPQSMENNVYMVFSFFHSTLDSFSAALKLFAVEDKEIISSSNTRLLSSNIG